LKKLLLLIAVFTFLLANLADACTPAMGYVESCRSSCIGGTGGGTCTDDPQLPNTAYCLAVSGSGTCTDGPYDDCCSGHHIF
jgi:hypothetical protein